MVMVDVSDKPEVIREATAKGRLKLKPETIKLIRDAKIAKGDPLYTAKIAGTLAAKRTSSLIPLCHSLPLTKVEVEAKICDKSTVQVTATVKTKARTGVEMEALIATALSILPISVMIKQYEKNKRGQYPTTAINGIRVIEKTKKDTENERNFKEA